MTRERQFRRGRIVAGALVAVALLALTAPSVAQNATYYNNSSAVVQTDSPSEANLTTIVDAAVSLSPSLIGTGEQDPSGTGFQGILLTGLVFGGVALGSMAGTRIGAVGGTVLGSFVSYAFVDLGYAPAWLKPLLLIGIGTVAFLMFRRVLE
jgi:outer membrane lipoprotein SlyB